MLVLLCGGSFRTFSVETTKAQISAKDLTVQATGMMCKFRRMVLYFPYLKMLFCLQAKMGNKMYQSLRNLAKQGCDGPFFFLVISVLFLLIQFKLVLRIDTVMTLSF